MDPPQNPIPPRRHALLDPRLAALRLRAALPGPPRITRRNAPPTPVARNPAPRSTAIQCVFANVTVRRVDPNGPHAAAINTFIESLKGAIDRAYQYALQNPGLGVLAQLDGHTAHWVNLWTAYLQTGISQLSAAAFGYVIESLVSIKGSPYRANPPGGYDLVFQAVKGQTRPDIILTHNGIEVAWLDITASDSPEHIFTQKVGWATQTNVAEITYPSTDISLLNKISSGVSPDFDISAIDREIRFQKAWAKELRKRFKQMGVNLKQIFVGKMPSKREAGGDALCRNWTRTNLFARGPFAGMQLSNPEISAILYALKLTPKTYGFDDGVSQSVGEHLLTVKLGIPQVSAPPETIPRSLPFFPSTPPLQPPPFFPPQSQALVPVQQPPSFQFNAPSFGSSFGNSFGSPFGSQFGARNPFSQPNAPPFVFNFNSPLNPPSPSPSGPSRSRIPRLEHRSHKHRPERASRRFEPGGSTQRLTIRRVVTELTRQRITFSRISRAIISFHDPRTGQHRTFTYARPGFRPGNRPRPSITFSANTLQAPSQPGFNFNFTPPSVALPNAPTPPSPDLIALFGTGSIPSQLADANVDLAAIEYDDQ